MTTRPSGPIRDYLDAVGDVLPLRGRSRRRALADLDAALRAAADDLGEADAVAAFGPAADRARDIAASLPADTAPPTLFGIPVGLDPRTLGDRLSAQMDPSGPWAVPRVFGVGWDLNIGRLLAATGVIRGDDIDEDLARVLPESAWWWAAGHGLTGLVFAGATAVDGLRRMDSAPLSWPAFGDADEWGAPRRAFGRCGALALAGTGLVLGSVSRRPRMTTRVACLAAGVLFVDISATMTAMTRWGGRRSGAWVLAGTAAGVAHAALISGSLIRAGVARTVQKEGHSHAH